MQKLKLVAGAAALAAMLVACTSVFRTEQLATDTAYGALQSWVSYYKAATNGASDTTIADLNKKARQVNDASVKFALTVKEVDTLREIAQTNSAAQPQLNAALSAVSSESSNILYIVKQFTGK